MWRWSRTTRRALSARRSGFGLSSFASNNQRCCLSSSPASGKKPVVVSRRAWEAHKKKHAAPVSAAPKKAKEESKPWPRNFQIAGYVAALLGIPYSVLWFVSSNKGIRDKLADRFPSLNDRLRSHFGSPEFDEFSYVDIKDEKMTPHQVLADEWPYKVRQQQEETERLNEESIPVRLSLLQKEEGSQHQPLVTLPPKNVSGSLPATQNALLGLAEASRDYMVDSSSTQENLLVAVDFQDVSSPAEDDTRNEAELAFSDSTSTQNEVTSAGAKPTYQQELYSSWFYQPDKPAATNQRMSDQDVQISRLEYEIERLKADLKDVNCTRNVDDMQRELKEAKAELRSIVWKRRLRM